MSKWWRSAGALAVICAATAQGAEPATQPRVGATPEVFQQALGQLADEDFAVREKAGARLQQILAEQLRGLVAAATPESQQRLQALLEFEEGLTRWAIRVLKMPPAQRKSMLAWGLKDDKAPALAKAFAGSPAARADGIMQLGKLKDAEASVLLAALISDGSREVYVAAMEAVWDRPPCDEVVEALWQRAVAIAWGLNTGAGRGVVYDSGAHRRAQDSAVATDTLVHLKPPQLQSRLKAFFQALEKDQEQRKNVEQANIMGPWSEPARNLYRLLALEPVTEAVPFLLGQATGGAKFVHAQLGGKNGQIVTARTGPLVALILMAGLKPEDFGAKRIAGNMVQYYGEWAFASDKAETDAVEKVKAWWDKKLGQAAATAPGTAPAK